MPLIKTYLKTMTQSSIYHSAELHGLNSQKIMAVGNGVFFSLIEALLTSFESCPTNLFNLVQLQLSYSQLDFACSWKPLQWMCILLKPQRHVSFHF